MFTDASDTWSGALSLTAVTAPLEPTPILMDRRLGVCGRYRLGRETDADAGAIHRGSESVQVLFVASQRTVSMGWTDQTASLVDLATE